MAVILDTLARKRRAAEAFVDLGFALCLIGPTRVPLRGCAQCPSGHHAFKDCPHPPSTCHGWAAGSNDLDHVLRLLDHNPDANLGIVNSMSGLVTVDIDTNKHGKPKPDAYRGIENIHDGWDVFGTILERYHSLRWPDACLEVSTPSGGGHMTWRLPPGVQVKTTSDGSFGWLIDIRANGSYTPAPGTPVKNGCYRRVSEVANPGLAPEWLLHHLKVTKHFPEPPRPVQPRTPRPDRNRDWGYERLDRVADQYATAPQGTGHAALLTATTAAAHLVAEGLVSETDARNELYNAGANRPRDSQGQRDFEAEFPTAWRTALSNAGGAQ